MPVPAPSDKRFRRAHVSPRSRRPRDRAWWIRTSLIGVVVVLCLIGAYTLVRMAAVSSALTITRITVEGAVRMPEGVVQDELSELIGHSMFGVDLDLWRDRLKQIRWVADASLRRVLPGTLAVTITERQPIAIGRVNDTLNLIDTRGVILDAYGPNYRDLDLPIVDGLAFAGDEEVGEVEQARAMLAVRLLSDLQRQPELANMVSQVDVSDAHNAVVVVKGDTALLQLGETRFAERLQTYLDIAERLKEDGAGVDTVDLRYGNRVYVNPNGRGDGKGTGGGE